MILLELIIAFFKGGLEDPSFYNENNISGYCPRWILIHIKLNSCWKKLFVLVVTNILH
jgi:hypothetical protein